MNSDNEIFNNVSTDDNKNKVIMQWFRDYVRALCVDLDRRYEADFNGNVESYYYS